MSFDVLQIRQQFPILSRTVHNRPLVYLDNAATTQKPQVVIDAIVDYYSNYNSNVHRGAHQLADEATRKYEDARDTVASFINANSRNEVIWTSGTTESINIVTHGMAQKLRSGDEVIVTQMEHHANLVTWQQACKASGATLLIAPINDAGELIREEFIKLIGARTRMVSIPHASNALGTLNPIKALISEIKKITANQALVMIDGAQGIAHSEVDVQQLNCDFYAFSSHKFYGPTGLGVLWGKENLLTDWPVWQTGGEMISEVSYQDAKWNTLPYRLEAGTPNIAAVIGFAAAINWFKQLDIKAVLRHEDALLTQATQMAEDFSGLRIIGSASAKVPVLSFVMDRGHPADIGFILDRQGVAIRTGHHCAEPLMNRLSVPGTARASFALYNTSDDVEQLFVALKKVKMMLA
ncbi:MAG: cysteine desulfurase [Pseudomonadales bacterium]|nr:cysteine desulfurase [Pseudomonadales bacterium]NRA18600.1 cysteine desulfurase [Oceanospirillaceae bacterium]